MSNMNRSMEAQASSGGKGLASGLSELDPQSGSQVWHAVALWFIIFSTTYEHMHKEILCKDQECYRNNVILHILGEKNERIKSCQERFQEYKDHFDVIFTCQESIYISETCQTVHMINVDMAYSQENAICGSLTICSLTELLLAVGGKAGRCFRHTVCFH
ncbi:hypothetical protein FD755_012229 [Muntiacus reevesi]|uniref:RNA polymerase II subunit A C-terminal domain phosphatase SSU72 n=1 Tax=Muntiacus reevesi TaxID=9886 RepID=A0A5N3XNT4_MUNRE|nr:hypothetical protein FD755_012229 [Muntiacus reevesi]